ncbi:MAG: nitroreductase family protein [Patescibacteria group bacterium]|nr:nitroreductase family protein [Patescibacteria group bacterium]
MSFAQTAEHRRSIHNFLPMEITDAQIQEMVRIAALSPSGYNAQPWEFVFYRDREKIKDLHQLCMSQDQVLESSAVCVVVGDKNIVKDPDQLVSDWAEYGYIDEEYGKHWKPKMRMERPDWKTREMVIRNAALACMSLMYAADDMGIANCPMMGVRQMGLRKWMDLPEDKMPVMVIVMGKEDTEKTLERLPRKSVNELLHLEEYNSSVIFSNQLS